MANKLLLIVEDDYDVAEMLLTYFKSNHYDVIHADNGTDGVNMARTKFPNLILLDVMLPDMDGYDVCVRLRNTAMTRYIPIVFLTQKDERASKVRGLELGADDYITKPFDIDELRLRVQGSIRRATRENLHESRTGLPTGPMIDEVVQTKAGHNQPFSELVYTIEGFRFYHDQYGFVASDDVMAYAGNTIQKVVGEFGTQNDFVGIQEDRLIVLTHTDDIDQLDAIIKERFAEEVRAFYNFMDVDQGGLLINEGTDTEEVVPLMYFSSQRQQIAPI